MRRVLKFMASPRFRAAGLMVVLIYFFIILTSSTVEQVSAFVVGRQESRLENEVDAIKKEIKDISHLASERGIMIIDIQRRLSDIEALRADARIIKLETSITGAEKLLYGIALAVFGLVAEKMFATWKQRERVD